MGFTGLEHWSSSDEAADFVFSLQKAIKKTIDSELKNRANSFNTPGWVNLALALEGSVIGPDLFDEKQLEKAIENGAEEIKEWDSEHRPRLKKLLKILEKALDEKDN